MANGDADNMLGRLKSLLPPGWFAKDTAPLRDVVLGGLSDSLAASFAMLGQGRDQTRITTATGYFLDLIAWDFFGGRFVRREGELDEDFRLRILREILRPRATRDAIIQAVTDLGCQVEIFEPWNPGDCGAYDVGGLAYADGGSPAFDIGGYGAGGGYDAGGIAYDVTPGLGTAPSPGAGRYGSVDLPNQLFVTVRRGAVNFAGIEGAGAYDVGSLAYAGDPDGSSGAFGYDNPGGGYNTGALSYFVPTTPFSDFAGAGFYGPPIPNNVTDDEIYATIAATAAAGVVAWTAIDPA